MAAFEQRTFTVRVWADEQGLLSYTVTSQGSPPLVKDAAWPQAAIVLSNPFADREAQR